jgi:hypothetical protein
MSELFVPISDHESSQLVGGQFTVRLEEVGPIERGIRSSRVGPNVTGILINNKSNLDLNYGIVYDGGFNDLENATVKAGESNTHYALDKPAAALGWDEDLAQPGMQLDLARLKPGYEYNFSVV